MKSLNIPVLYGSQTGNSEAAAKNLASTLPSSLSSSATNLTITATAMELDDFLEKSRAQWAPLMVIVCSSYGVGQAPMGAWKFREMCDKILEDNGKGSDSLYENKLKGVKYAMLGLGDSKYTTFFLNPTAIDSAMAKAGAERVGSLGKADASGEGEKLQSKVIEDWSRDIVKDLAFAVKEINGLSLSDEMWNEKEAEMKAAKEVTGDICRLIYEDWDAKSGNALNTEKVMMIIPLILAILVAIYLKSS